MNARMPSLKSVAISSDTTFAGNKFYYRFLLCSMLQLIFVLMRAFFYSFIQAESHLRVCVLRVAHVGQWKWFDYNNNNFILLSHENRLPFRLCSLSFWQ